MSTHNEDKLYMCVNKGVSSILSQRHWQIYALSFYSASIMIDTTDVL